ncbi:MULTISPECIES: hypothetical protein [unclassified Gilliamella]|nr:MULTISPECIES: hypothetical protein [unclassified Gilliamella]
MEIKSVWWQQLMLGKIWAAIAILNISAWSLSDKKTPTLSWAV